MDIFLLHESQKAPEETQTEALDFMEVIRPKLQLQYQNKAFILNMDQTPIPFTFNSKTTLEVVALRRVSTRRYCSLTAVGFLSLSCDGFCCQ